jgi:hypothetical protein
MRVELGNNHPQEVLSEVDPATGLPKRRDLAGPAVTYCFIHDGDDANGNPLYSFPDVHDDGLLTVDMATALSGVGDEGAKTSLRRLLLKGHLADPSGVTHLPNHAAFVGLTHATQGIWNNVAKAGTKPSWVWSDDDEYMRFAAEYFDTVAGRPADLEDTHHTQYGNQVYMPGVRPDPAGGLTALHTNIGRDQQGTQMFAWGYLGTTGTATASSATSLTGGTETGASHSSNDSAGQTVVITAPSGDAGKYAIIASNTSGTTPVYTVDRWYTPSNPGGAAATTPSATATYVIMQGGQPSVYVGLSTSTATPAAGDTTLASEITTSGGGLIRKIGSVTHTAGAATVLNTAVFTANGSDSLPVTVGKAGLSQSITSGYSNSYQTLVSPTATLSASGDQLTLSWTFTET